MAVTALVHGSILLVREKRLVAQVLHERARNVRAAEARRSQPREELS